MSEYWKNLVWLLSGGINRTLRQRNEMRARLEGLQVEMQQSEDQLRQSRDREQALTEKLKRSVSEYPLPFIMLNTLPKSGSVYLAECLYQGLNIPFKQVSPGYFPMDLIDYRKILEASAGQAISQAHLDANPTNLQLLRQFAPRMVLNLRDPRQALLSWVHHLKRYLDMGHSHTLTFVTPAPTASVVHGNLSAAIDWHLAHHMPNLLSWMEQWLAHVESGEKPKVLVTHYEDFLENQEGFIARILEFYDIPAHAYTPKLIPKNGSTHFRKGLRDEWKDVFNPAQQKICAEMMAGYPRVSRLYPSNPASKSAPLAAKQGASSAPREHPVEISPSGQS